MTSAKSENSGSKTTRRVKPTRKILDKMRGVEPLAGAEVLADLYEEEKDPTRRNLLMQARLKLLQDALKGEKPAPKPKRKKAAKPKPEPEVVEEPVVIPEPEPAPPPKKAPKLDMMDLSDPSVFDVFGDLDADDDEEETPPPATPEPTPPALEETAPDPFAMLSDIGDDTSASDDPFAAFGEDGGEDPFAAFEDTPSKTEKPDAPADDPFAAFKDEDEDDPFAAFDDEDTATPATPQTAPAATLDDDPFAAFSEDDDPFAPFDSAADPAEDLPDLDALKALETEAASAPVEDDDPFAALEGAEEEQGRDSLPSATDDIPIEAVAAVEATPDADPFAALEEEGPFAALAEAEEPDAELSAPEDAEAPKDQMASEDEAPKASEDASAGTAVPSPFEALEGLDNDDAPASEHVVSDDPDVRLLDAEATGGENTPAPGETDKETVAEEPAQDTLEATPADPFAALADLGEPDTQEATGADDMFAPFEVAKPDAEDSNAQLARLAAGGMAALADDTDPQDGTQPGEEKAEPLPEDHASETAQAHDALDMDATEETDADPFAAFSADDDPFAALGGAEEEQGHDSLPPATEDTPIEAVTAVESTADADPLAALEEPDTQEATGEDDDMFAPFEVAKPAAEDSNAQLARLAAGGMAALADDTDPKDGTQPGEEKAEPLPEDHASETAQDHDAPVMETTEEIDADPFAAFDSEDPASPATPQTAPAATLDDDPFAKFSEDDDPFAPFDSAADAAEDLPDLDALKALETEAVSAPVEDDPFAALEGAEEEQGHDSLPPATEDTPIEAEVAVEATPDADHLAATEEEDPFAALADVEEPDAELSAPEDAEAPKDQMASADEEPQASEDAAAGTAVPSPFEALEGLDDDDAPPSEHVVSDDADALPLDAEATGGENTPAPGETDKETVAEEPAQDTLEATPADPFAALADLGEPDTQEATGADDDMFAPFEVAKPDAEDSNAQLARLAAGGMAAFADDIDSQDGTQPGEDEAEPLPEDHASETAQAHDALDMDATEETDADPFAAFSADDDPFAALGGAEEEQGHDTLPSATEDTPIEAEVAVEGKPDADPLAATEEEDPFAALADVEEPDADLSSPEDTETPKDQMASEDEAPKASEDASAGTAVPSPFEALEGLDNDDAPASEHVVSDDPDVRLLDAEATGGENTPAPGETDKETVAEEPAQDTLEATPADPFAALADLGEPDTQEATGADDDMFAPFEVAKPDAEDSNAQLARLAAGGMAAFADDIAPQDGTQPGEDEAEPLPEDHAAELAQDHDAPGVEATEDIDADTFAAFSEDDHPFAALEGAEEEQGRDSLPSATDDIPIEAVAAVERTADTDPFAALEDEDPFAALADVDEPDAELSSPQDTDAPKDQMATADEEPQASEDAAAGTAVPSPFEALEGLDDDDAPPSEHVVSDDADALPLDAEATGGDDTPAPEASGEESVAEEPAPDTLETPPADPFAALADLGAPDTQEATGADDDMFAPFEVAKPAAEGSNAQLARLAAGGMAALADDTGSKEGIQPAEEKAEPLPEDHASETAQDHGTPDVEATEDIDADPVVAFSEDDDPFAALEVAEEEQGHDTFPSATEDTPIEAVAAVEGTADADPFAALADLEEPDTQEATGADDTPALEAPNDETVAEDTVQASPQQEEIALTRLEMLLLKKLSSGQKIPDGISRDALKSIPVHGIGHATDGVEEVSADETNEEEQSATQPDPAPYKDPSADYWNYDIFDD